MCVCVSFIAYGSGREEEGVGEKINRFWEELSRNLESFNLNERILVLEELNVKIGEITIQGEIEKIGCFL